jgi:hypothetical protein
MLNPWYGLYGEWRRYSHQSVGKFSVAFWDAWGILWSQDRSVSIATGYEMDA